MRRHEVSAYFFCGDRSRIVSWLRRELGELTLEATEHEDSLAPCRWQRLRAEGPTEAAVFIQDDSRPGSLEVTISVEASVDRPGQDLPWPSCAAFARAAAKALGVTLLCDPGEDYPQVRPLSDTFLRVTPEGEQLVHLDESPDGSTIYLPGA